MHSCLYFLGDTIHLSDIDMIAGTPVLDIKPYIPEYDSPHTRMGMDSNADQPQATTASLDETTDILNLHKDSETDAQLHQKRRRTDEEEEDVSGDVPAADSSRVRAQFSLHSVLEEVKAYVTQGDLRQLSCESEGQSVSDSPKTKPAESTVDHHPRYGEEAYSSIAGWIREPPVGSLEVRFTPHAEKELAEFLPTHPSGKPDSQCAL